MPKRTINVRDGRPLLDIASYGRRGPSGRDQFTQDEIAQISRTVRRVPEVMVKVSGGGTSTKAVAAHFRYIDRRGELDVQTDDGQHLKGRGIEKHVLADWDLETDELATNSPYWGKAGRKPAKLVHNIVLSMPKGTPADRLLAASGAFAREQFALKHRYAMVLHTDQDHPHVHLVVKAIGERGQRLNIRKPTLRGWRSEFARQLRAYGVEANATERAVRGQVRSGKIDGVFRAAQRGESTHMRTRAESVSRALARRDLQTDAAGDAIRDTRREVTSGWRGAIKLLQRSHPDLASSIHLFLESMPPAITEREHLADRLREQTRPVRRREETSTR